MNTNDDCPTPKRTDVGYKRPPKEHQFKKGQKPPPRKKRAQEPESFSRCLSKILGEEKRLKRGNGARWYTNGFLVLEVAFQLAENGNSTVSRALADYLMAQDRSDSVDDQLRIEHHRDGPTGIFNYTVRHRI